VQEPLTAGDRARPTRYALRRFRLVSEESNNATQAIDIGEEIVKARHLRIARPHVRYRWVKKHIGGDSRGVIKIPPHIGIGPATCGITCRTSQCPEAVGARAGLRCETHDLVAHAL
jgi:hypothetical protein